MQTVPCIRMMGKLRPREGRVSIVCKACIEKLDGFPIDSDQSALPKYCYDPRSLAKFEKIFLKVQMLRFCQI